MTALWPGRAAAIYLGEGKQYASEAHLSPDCLQLVNAAHSHPASELYAISSAADKVCPTMSARPRAGEHGRLSDSAFGEHGSKTKDGACVLETASAAAATAALHDDVTHSRQRDKPRHITTTDSLVRRTKQLSTHLSPLLVWWYLVTLVAELVTMTLEDDLTSAAAMGNTAEVERLLRAGADVNAANRLGHTALQAMMMGSTPVARLLLASGANPNVADSRTGTTPLHDAARTGFADMARLLVRFAADPQARDHTNCRPVDVARTHGHADVVAFLESLG
uniref:uncharacterized protein cdkn2a/b n=1 Tax=Doryrhamphus excisus TaxID=161450 RepID=UPI0025AE657C|nr:uncharacterized protein cdkn2a/b [Doryrhamphus excisus]